MKYERYRGPHQHAKTLDDFPPETQEWIRAQAAKADPIDDEEATGIVRHFLPEDHPPFVVVSVPVDDAAAPEP